MAFAGRTVRPVLDREKCQQCGVCVRACPAELLPDFRQDGNTVRGFIYSETDPGEKTDLAPCTAACPLGQKVRDYVRLLGQGRVREALLTIREDNPLPGLCGYVCHHPCEKGCVRGTWDDPVSIRELKRYAARYEAAHRDEILEILKGRKQPANGKKVVVIGAGPAGLSCGYELVMAGCDVTIMDALSEPGGMLVGGIPPFRLPRWVIAHDVGMIRELGVVFENQVRIGEDISIRAVLNRGAEAVVLATGAWRDMDLGMVVDGVKGYMGCLDFLGKVNAGQRDIIRGKVLVIGGGNAAMDTARSALRLGAQQVILLYRRTREEMPAIPDEVDAALREGVEMRYLVAPKRVVVQGGGVCGVELMRMEPGPPDETGRRRPVPVEGSAFVEPADFVITAIGQHADLSFLEHGAASKQGTVVCDGSGRVAGYDRLFAAGDAVSGPSTVVEAAASGKRAAGRVMEYLKGGEGPC